MSTRTPSRPRLMSIEDVAEYLGVNVKTLRNWRSKGIGPPGFLVGGLVRYRPTDLYAWVDAQADA